MAEERTQRYTQAERQSIKANRRAAAGGAKYGTSYAEQGYRPEKEAGMAYLKQQEQKARHGAFAPLSWRTRYDSAGNLVGVMPYNAQSGRAEALRGRGLDPTKWLNPEDVLAPGQLAAIRRTTTGAQGQRREAFFDANPELASRPGGGMDAWVHQRYLNNLRTDPATGWKINPQGELYDPSNRILTGGSGPNPQSMPGYGAQPYGYGYGYPQSGYGYPQGGYGYPGGYIPGYSMPFQPQGGYGMPQYGGYNLGNMRPQTTPNYRTLQQQGGSSFGTYPPYGGQRYF